MILKYPIEPEIMTVTTPLGTQHAIPIWRPIGERSKPVMVEVVVPPRAVNYQWLRDRIAKHMAAHDPGDAGLTHWQIADAMQEDRLSIRHNLLGNVKMFRRSDKTATATFIAGRGQVRSMQLPLWH